MNSLLNENLVQAAGWALLHSLWQGLAAAALVWAALWLLRGHSARLRCAIASAGLGGLALAAAATFVLSWPQSSPPARIAATELKGVQETAALSAASAPAAPNFRSPVEAALPWIVLLWASGVLFLSARCAASWNSLRRLRCNAAPVADPALLARLQDLKQRIAARPSVRLMQSALLDVPVAAGWLKPVIILPLASLTGLSPAQLDAILLHELAHVRRRDYLMNLAQVALETLLFYHPAVWWISEKIREEREYCCDDLVLSVQNDAACYARALALLEESRGSAPQFGMASQGGSLLRRIRRLTSPRHASRPGGAIVAAMLALICSGWLVKSVLASAETPAAPAVPEKKIKAETPLPSSPAPAAPALKGIALLEARQNEAANTAAKLQAQMRQAAKNLGMSERELMEGGHQRGEALRAMEQESIKTRISLISDQSLLNSLKKVSSAHEIPFLFPDEALSELLQAATKMGQELDIAQDSFSPEHASIKSAARRLKRAQQQIEERADVIRAGIAARIESATLRLEEMRLLIEQERRIDREMEAASATFFQLQRDREAHQRIAETLALRILQEKEDAKAAPAQ